MKNKYNPMKYDNISADGIYTNMDGTPFLNLKTGEFLLPFNPEQKRCLSFAISKGINVGSIAYPGIESWKMKVIIIKLAKSRYNGVLLPVDLRSKEVYMLTHMKHYTEIKYDERRFFEDVITAIRNGVPLGDDHPNFMQYTSSQISEIGLHYSERNRLFKGDGDIRVNPIAAQLGVINETVDYMPASTMEHDTIEWLQNKKTIPFYTSRTMKEKEQIEKQTFREGIYEAFMNKVELFDVSTDFFDDWFDD